MQQDPAEQGRDDDRGFSVFFRAASGRGGRTAGPVMGAAAAGPIGGDQRPAGSAWAVGGVMRNESE